MKKFKIREVIVPLEYCTVTIDQIATEINILIDIYNVDPIAAYNLGIAERHILLKGLREATNGKYENDQEN